MSRRVEEELERIYTLEQKLAKLLECSASMLEALTEVKGPSDAQRLVSTGPTEFANLLTDVRSSFKEVIEAAPKPGIPYYDPVPLERLLQGQQSKE